MSNIFKVLLIVLLAVISLSSSASTDGKKTANDGSEGNSSAGIGTKIKRIVTAGLLFTSLATGGAEATGRNNAQGGNAAGLVQSHVTNRAMKFQWVGLIPRKRPNDFRCSWLLCGTQAESALPGIKELHVVGGTDHSALAPKSDYQLGTATNFMYLSHWKDEQEENVGPVPICYTYLIDNSFFYCCTSMPYPTHPDTYGNMCPPNGFNSENKNLANNPFLLPGGLQNVETTRDEVPKE